ncbi:9257_t:CDS:2, partial [Gigaspora margarita]
ARPKLGCLLEIRTHFKFFGFTFWMESSQVETWIRYYDIILNNNTYSTNHFNMAFSLFIVIQLQDLILKEHSIAPKNNGLSLDSNRFTARVQSIQYSQLAWKSMYIHYSNWSQAYAKPTYIPALAQLLLE